MRLNINLATQPYEDARRFMITWATILGGLTLILIVLSIGVASYWQTYRRMSANLRREEQILQDLDNKQQQGMAILNRPDNRDVREKSDFVNELIARKQVSWTRIFVDLEQLMPSHLRVLGITPQWKDEKITLQMELDGDSREKAFELARRMERSRVFHNAQIDTENVGQNNGQVDMHFHVTAEYVPGQTLATPESDKAATADAGEGR